MVTLVTIGIQNLSFCILLELLILYILVYFHDFWMNGWFFLQGTFQFTHICVYGGEGLNNKPAYPLCKIWA